jgi:hypothetical protein
MIEDIDIEKDDLLSQLEKAKKEGKVEKTKPQYIRQKSTLDKLNKFMKNKVYGETDLLK